MSKLCTDCKILKLIDEFYKNRNNCRDCHKKRVHNNYYKKKDNTNVVGEEKESKLDFIIHENATLNMKVDLLIQKICDLEILLGKRGDLTSKSMNDLLVKKMNHLWME